MSTAAVGMSVREWLEAWTRKVRTSPRQVTDADVRQLLDLVQARTKEPCGRHSTGHLWGRESYIVVSGNDFTPGDPTSTFFRHPTGISDVEWVLATTPGLGPIRVGTGSDTSPTGDYTPRGLS